MPLYSFIQLDSCASSSSYSRVKALDIDTKLANPRKSGRESDGDEPPAVCMICLPDRPRRRSFDLRGATRFPVKFYARQQVSEAVALELWSSLEFEG